MSYSLLATTKRSVPACCKAAHVGYEDIYPYGHISFGLARHVNRHLTFINTLLESPKTYAQSALVYSFCFFFFLFFGLIHRASSLVLLQYLFAYVIISDWLAC